MGTFHVEVEVGDPEGHRYEVVEALVDTGATYTSVPRSILDALGVEPHERAWFRLANGQHIEREIGRTWVRVGGRAEFTLVVFADPGSPVLLGAYALEGLRLAPDPVNRCLVPVPGLLMPLVPTPA